MQRLLSNALVEFKEKLGSIWNAVYDVSCVEDVKHVHARIEAVLSSGLTDRDRADLESIDRDISVFLSDMVEFSKREFSRETIQTACDALREKYEDQEFDVSLVIDGLLNETIEKMEVQERQWISRFLTIVPESLEQHELDKWKRDTQPLPLFISSETAEEYDKVYARVEQELAKQRVNYIAMLFDQLSEQEKRMVLARLKV